MCPFRTVASQIWSGLELVKKSIDERKEKNETKNLFTKVTGKVMHQITHPIE